MVEIETPKLEQELTGYTVCRRGEEKRILIGTENELSVLESLERSAITDDGNNGRSPIL